MPDPDVAQPPSAVIRVLICDDHAIVRQGLQTFLELQDGIEVVGQAADGEEAVSKAAAMRPDVVLMDLVMPRLDGIEAIRRIRAAQATAKIIVLTSFADDDKVFPAIKAGATGYLMKDVAPNELANAIRMASEGESILHPDVARRLISEVRGEHAQPPIEGAAELARLTVREREVLCEIARGRANKEIAQDLVLSEKTVKTHVSNILQKLGLADRTQAALFAVRHHLVEP
jgi:NarL family two-component system response regulator LiaR